MCDNLLSSHTWVEQHSRRDENTQCEAQAAQVRENGLYSQRMWEDQRARCNGLIRMWSVHLVTYSGTVRVIYLWLRCKPGAFRDLSYSCSYKSRLYLIIQDFVHNFYLLCEYLDLWQFSDTYLSGCRTSPSCYTSAEQLRTWQPMKAYQRPTRL